MNNEILVSIERSDAVPSMPQIVTRLFEIIRDPNYRQEDIVRLLSTDPGMAADVLRLANSPLFGVTRKVNSVAQATTLLGIKRLRTLVMGRCMVDRVSKKGTQLIDTSYYWRRSLTTGVLSARFADIVVPTLREEAFITGLLSDVGMNVLARTFPEAYKPAAEAYSPHRGTELVGREIAAVGVSHADVSALVLERWTLPETMVTAVRHHHDIDLPSDLPEEVAKLTRVVHGASDIARLLCEVPDSNEIAATCVAAMNIAGLETSILIGVLHEIEADITELAGVLRIDVIPSRVYGIIASTVAERLGASV